MQLTHEEKLSRITQALRSRDPGAGPLSLKKDAVSHMVPNPRDPRHRDKKLDLRGLNEILEIDPVSQTCTAEPGVTFSELLRETLKHGLMPKLVPELKTITIGGAVSGCSVESLSHKFGGFHDSCLEYEVITALGEALRCTPEENPEIFHMIHGSYGTLGVLSKIKFRLIPAKRYVRMDYVSYPNFQDFSRAMLAACRSPDTGFIDAILHSPKECVLCLGTLVDSAPYTSDYSFLKIFYKSTRRRKQDYLKLEDYLFRYDTECHWLSRTIPGMETLPMRLAFGKFLLGSTNLLTWSKRLRPLLKFDKRPDVVVDVFIPSNQLEKFWTLYMEKIRYFPLWIVPYRRVQTYPWLHPDYEKRINDDLFIDLAVYGLSNRGRDRNYYRILEEMVLECNGIKTLISHNFYDRETFWKIYNRSNWEKVKRRTDPHNLFRDLYEKFHFQTA